MVSFVGETPRSMQFSTMSSLEARIFAPSSDPEGELRELRASLDSNHFLGHMRIAGILSQGPGPKLGAVRRHFAYALTESELQLLDEENAQAVGIAPVEGSTTSRLEDICGIFCYCLGEVSEHLGRNKEAEIHFANGVKYFNMQSSMKLALYEKQAGRFDRAQFLLTSAAEDDDLDIQYLLGDLFQTKGELRTAREYYVEAAAAGQTRAAQRLAELDQLPAMNSKSGSEEEVDLGNGWTALVNNLDGGIFVYFEGREIEDLEGHSMLRFILDSAHMGPEDLFSELETHRSMVNDLKVRSITYRDDSRAGLVQSRTSDWVSEDDFFEVVIDLESGKIATYRYKNLTEALRALHPKLALHQRM